MTSKFVNYLQVHLATTYKPRLCKQACNSRRFTEKECWYQHKPEESFISYQNDNINMEYPNNVNQRILDVMEKFTERLQMLEDQI